jgi:oxygen-independent coproporphyrinogen-3 oxidase
VAGPLPIGEKWPEDNVLRPQRVAGDTFHAYVHIPFCTVRCGYCDFNTYTQQEMPGVALSDFHNPLLKEIEFSRQVLDKSNLSQPPLSSIFFGGGTPSLFSPAQIQSILDELEQSFGFTPDCEITMEANPESTSPWQLEKLREAGVNRVSIGVQSFDSMVLSVLDRQHDKELVMSAVQSAQSLGFRTSIDLIFGAPGESLESWKSTVQQALDLKTDHISAYSLIVEPGTKLARQISRGEIAEVNEDLNADKYEWAADQFEDLGLQWYEVSNFGEVAKHNLAYWQSKNWWGYGPGAHSHVDGNRFWNQKHPARYQQGLAKGSPAAGIEKLSERQQLEEELMLGLRTKYGVSRDLPAKLGIDPVKIAQQISTGTLTMQQDRLLPTKAGRLLVDRLVVDFLQ